MRLVDALVCSAPGSLHVEQRPAPRPADGQALVRPRRIGLCGTDYHIYEGKHPFLEYPRIMGHELAVEVVQTPVSSRFAPGEICIVNPYLSCGECIACRVGKANCCVRLSVLGVHQDGGMMGLLALPEANLIPSRGLTLDECAVVEFLAIGAHAVRRGCVDEGDRVLVVGAGPIGLGVALFASLAGGAVTLLDREADRTALARALLGLQTIPGTGNPVASVREATDGDGYDVVFDATGNRHAMEQSFDFVAHGGRYVLVGVIAETISFQDPDFHRKELTLFASRNATLQDFERVIAAIRSGEVPVGRLITHRTSLAEAVGNIPVWASRKLGLVKAMIEVGA
jgi:2-desacetyl-2-hydroxyethyl bacteriochlorophyllide A dehydrogenase